MLAITTVGTTRARNPPARQSRRRLPLMAPFAPTVRGIARPLLGEEPTPSSRPFASAISDFREFELLRSPRARHYKLAALACIETAR